MVRRALESDVERNFEPQLRGPGDESSEVVQRSQLRMYALVAALLGAYCPGTAEIPFATLGVVVRAFARYPPDRMNGGR